MDKDELKKIAGEIMAPGKGILAADWSLGSTEKHFLKNSIEHTEEARRRYREMLFTTEGLENYISGVIFFDEGLRQKTKDDKTFVKVLEEKGIIPGIKVDKGNFDMANFPGEKITEGLDGLRERFAEYKNMGAKFAKWRSAIAIGDGIPTEQCIISNAEAMARYAALSQEAGLVPIVEPEDLMEGKHDMMMSETTTKRVLSSVFSALEKHKVFLEGTILKTNYVHPGTETGDEINYEEIAEATIRVFNRVVPPALPGIVFLSGGDSSEEATKHLNSVAKITPSAPWKISFSYARALQYPAISIWGGKDENIKDAQEALMLRAKLNSLATQGKYSPEMEK